MQLMNLFLFLIKEIKNFLFEIKISGHKYSGVFEVKIISLLLEISFKFIDEPKSIIFILKLEKFCF